MEHVSLSQYQGEGEHQRRRRRQRHDVSVVHSERTCTASLSVGRLRFHRRFLLSLAILLLTRLSWVQASSELRIDDADVIEIVIETTNTTNNNKNNNNNHHNEDDPQDAVNATNTNDTNSQDVNDTSNPTSQGRQASSSSSSSSSSPPPALLSQDTIEDSLFDPIQADPDCEQPGDASCYDLPETTVEQVPDQTVLIDATCSYGGDDPAERNAEFPSASSQQDQTITCTEEEQPQTIHVDKHWGSDPNILWMRDKLRRTGMGTSGRTRTSTDDIVNKRPPIFLMPGLASTRLIAWRYKECASNPLLSNIKVQDNVWLNINLVVQMSTIDVTCMRECLKLGWNQSDTDNLETGCKLRPDEGLDAISSLSPGGIGSTLLVGGTNTVYAWLIQWLADNLGYDVSNIVGLPYDWRMSPDKMEERDGFLTLTRRRIEAAVQANGQPGIMVAHSMGNIIFRYFLEWLRTQLREESYDRYIKQAERRAKVLKKANIDQPVAPSSYLPGWMSGIVSGFDEWWLSRHGHEANSCKESPEDCIESDTRTNSHRHKSGAKGPKHPQLWELAQMEGDDLWYEWIETHIWSYVGLSAPMLGAVNPLRAVISGENMGLPVTDEAARVMELTFGSTHTVNPISSREGFCDQWEADRWDEETTPSNSQSKRYSDARLACLDDIYTDIEFSSRDHAVKDPWKNFPALRAFLKDRRDWDSDFDMIKVVKEFCAAKETSPCEKNSTLSLGPRDVQTGNLFTQMNDIWKEKDDPLLVKREQLRESFWDNPVTNMLNRTWERPLIKHVIMAYGVDIPTEVGYIYRKTEYEGEGEETARKGKKGSKSDESYDGIPNLETAIWELPGGRLENERMETSRSTLAELITGKKPKRSDRRQGGLAHSGDGSVPYLSLAWAHTWLLHAVRAMQHSDTYEGPENPLDNIEISHRPKGAMEWVEGPPPPRIEIIGEDKKVEESSDTGTAHPHGTKYKPEMVRYHNQGTSRTTGIEYTTTVIEAIGVEHKETTRNFDILAAVFTDVLKFMHDEL